MRLWVPDIKTTKLKVSSFIPNRSLPKMAMISFKIFFNKKEAVMQIQTALAKIVESKNLSREESAQVFNLIMTGETTDAQIGAFLAAMRVKGETAEELAGAAETMRSLSSKVPLTSTEN
ncbi:MAG: hypothetical protein Ct9H90mP27_2690 [Gammaproteobacteria bacterium]|nr:MAG: hypothetical protein Ct9H90mP27_2690 [Gammaproteobacteria bacterium]